MSVPALLHGFILREIDVRSITQYLRPYLRLKLHILSVTLLLQELECYRAVTREFINILILREIDLTLTLIDAVILLTIWSGGSSGHRLGGGPLTPTGS